jgi:hypothetical protein
MKLWLISQDFNSGWDTFDSAVVAADSEEEARNTQVDPYGGAWCKPEHVQVRLIGEALPLTSAGVVLASFNAG